MKQISKLIGFRMGAVIVMAITAFITSSCGSDSNPFVQDCASNNTAEVNFRNNSTTSKTYDVLWDGSRIVSNLAPGQTSQNFTVNASTHQLEFRIAGSNTAACSTAYPSPSQCSGHTYSCDN